MRVLLPIFIVLLAAARPSAACLWDYDTLAMERQRFPEAHELIAGYFVRHSDAYYRWRIEDRTAKVEADRTPGDYDDIAVAQEKLGQHDAAMETIREKIKRWPDEGEYESQANLGTFLIHAGRYEEGLEHINAAIEINPDAHFGREIYQKLLVEYVIAAREGRPSSLPLSEDEYSGDGFFRFVLDQQQLSNADSDDKASESQRAVHGVLGMMRFGNHDSPVLLEALGDLLGQGHYPLSDAKMLAARAYLRASYEVDDPSVAEAYRLKAEHAMQLQSERSLEEIEASLKEEIADGKALAEQIATDEAQWAAAGLDLDEQFAAKYYDTPQLDPDRANWRPWTIDERILAAAVTFLGGLLLVIATIVYLVVRWRRRSARA
ncbi:hypothetical protein [Aeoliella sp.]|uniref:hypothetical protein n=1 Tax=Aeoliella sp. TaxID=2795800 RepID=UPI003CCC1654